MMYLLAFPAEVKMPSGHIDQPVIEDNHDGTVSIKYDPREEGVHELFVKYNGEHVQGKCTVHKLGKYIRVRFGILKKGEYKPMLLL